MTKIQRFFSGATCNKMQVLDDVIDLDEKTLGQGHDIPLCHEHPLSTPCMNFLYFFFKTV